MATASRRHSRRRAALRLLAVVNGLALAMALGFAANAAPPTTQLRFVNQPNTTQTGDVIRDGFDSTGSPIAVEFFDPSTGNVANVNAQVTLSFSFNPAGGSLTGATATASKGVAVFSTLKTSTDGTYRLRASSLKASNQPTSDPFLVADQVTTCSGSNCAFTLAQGQNSYSTDPTTGTKGDPYSASLNINDLRVSCDFDPYFYPDSRQPNSVYFDYQGDTTKVVTIVIDKKIVQETAENGSAHYRVCFSAPYPFTDINGVTAPVDPWSDGPNAYFEGTWHTGLLPDCRNPNPEPPCVLSWSASGGDRIGKFLAPKGDPIFR